MADQQQHGIRAVGLLERERIGSAVGIEDGEVYRDDEELVEIDALPDCEDTGPTCSVSRLTQGLQFANKGYTCLGYAPNG